MSVEILKNNHYYLQAISLVIREHKSYSALCKINIISILGRTIKSMNEV